jgi:hypothetical protein
MVRAKFYVIEVAETAYGPGTKPVEQKRVRMTAVTSDSEENKSWSKWTPSGSLEMVINNPAAYEQFKPGQVVFLTLEPEA